MSFDSSTIDTILSTIPRLQSKAEPLESRIEALQVSQAFENLMKLLVRVGAHDNNVADEFKRRSAIGGLPALRMLRFAPGLHLGQCMQQLAILFDALSGDAASNWKELAKAVQNSKFAAIKTLDFLKSGAKRESYQIWETQLLKRNPHALYPTSPYRTSEGHVVSRDDFTEVEAVATSRIHTSIRITEGVLSPEHQLLRETYKPLGRCVCVIDENVEHFFGWQAEAYFAHHEIELEKIVYRAMEVDKGIATVERMLGDFKQLGVARNEPVLVIGGGVLSDTAGLACALYHRGTPYVMLSTSIVAGIDAGPSPRTCCDGFGYKNLFGAYHPPILSITDRTFFKTLKPGWLRHGIAEIIKMAVVKDVTLFEHLETAGDRLISSRFGASGEACDDEVRTLSELILGRAIKSYVEAEYGNLYETHQCRPHAYGHTWSPGFEMSAGLLHGHAVSVGMGWGAFLSERLGWIAKEDMQRITNLIASFGLSLWHDVLEDAELIWASQRKMTEKRGGHLAAPLPQNAIGQCGYLNSLSERELRSLMKEYREYCRGEHNSGRGIEPLCKDVGLEDPSTIGR